MWRGSNAAVCSLILIIATCIVINAGFITEMALESQSVMDAADKYLFVRLYIAILN